MKFLSFLRGHQAGENPIIVVSGLPRSGTSLMMQILQAGGLEILTDNARLADLDNPKGYYEYERVKKLKDGDVDWVRDARGKVIKVVAPLLEYLPSKYPYLVIFMQRNMEEILASQKQMLIRRGEATDNVSDDTLADLYRKHLDKIEAWLAGQRNMQVLYVRYDALIQAPSSEIENIVRFLDFPLDIQAMRDVPDSSLYRQRS
jgi:hypothetical protein